MTRKEKLESTRQKILNSTEKLMRECKDSSEVTSRRIALEADVQLAMINYCFGSREALLFEIFQKLHSNYETENQIAQILEAESNAKEKLRKIYFYVAQFLLKEYKFTEAITSYVLLNRDLSKGLHTSAFVIAFYNGKKTEEECKLIAYELSSTVQLALCRKEALKDFCGLDLNQTTDLKKYIDLQMDLFLKEA